MAKSMMVAAGLALVVTGCAGSGSAGNLHPSPGASSVTSAHQGNTRRVAVLVGSPPLQATLTLPGGAGRFPAVVLVSGSGPNDQDETLGPNKPFRDLADGLAGRGVATLRYDKRTKDYPQSIDPATFTATQEYVPDALAAVDLLRHRLEVDTARIFLLGHSQGGTFAPKIAGTLPPVAGVILMAAGSEPFATALLRQVTYLSTLPDPIGSSARAQLPTVRELVSQIESPDLGRGAPLNSAALGGAGAAYFLDLRAYDEVAVARSLPQPILVLQGDRDYQVTVADDLTLWIHGLAGRPHVTIRRYSQANHLFLDGTGPPSPADYQQPGHVQQQVIADIATWVVNPTTAA